MCFIAFLILYPAYDTVAIRWPKLKSPESFVADCEFLLKNYPEQSSVPADEWPTSIAEIQPRHVLVKDGYVDIVISTGGIGDSWGVNRYPKRHRCCSHIRTTNRKSPSLQIQVEMNLRANHRRADKSHAKMIKKCSLLVNRPTSYPGSISARFDLSDSASQKYIYYSKVRFKFKWGPAVANEERHPVKYYVIFTPEDDPDTEDIDESEEIEFVGSKTIECGGAGRGRRGQT